jgi:hypothetical protein
MADPNPIKTWRIELRGFPTDLVSWQQLFKDRAVASVELSSGRDGQPTYFVCSQRLDDVRDTEAYTCAEKLLAQLNGAARLSDLAVHLPVQMAWLWYVRAEGRPEPMKEVSSTIQVGLEWSATVGAPPDAGSFAASREQKVMKAMIAAGRSDQTALALEYFGRPNNWYDMWTAYEIIEEELFLRTDPLLRPKGDKKIKPRRVF